MTCKYRKTKPKRCPHCDGVLPQRRPCEALWPYGESPKYPKEVAGLKRILEMRIAGMTMRAIAEQMQAEGFKLRRGAKWNPGTVCRIVKRAEKRIAEGSLDTLAGGEDAAQG